MKHPNHFSKNLIFALFIVLALVLAACAPDASSNESEGVTDVVSGEEDNGNVNNNQGDDNTDGDQNNVHRMYADVAVVCLHA